MRICFCSTLGSGFRSDRLPLTPSLIVYSSLNGKFFFSVEFRSDSALINCSADRILKQLEAAPRPNADTLETSGTRGWAEDCAD